MNRLRSCFLHPQISPIYADFIVRHFGVVLDLHKSVPICGLEKISLVNSRIYVYQKAPQANNFYSFN